MRSGFVGLVLALATACGGAGAPAPAAVNAGPAGTSPTQRIAQTLGDCLAPGVVDLEAVLDLVSDLLDRARDGAARVPGGDAGARPRLLYELSGPRLDLAGLTLTWTVKVDTDGDGTAEPLVEVTVGFTAGGRPTVPFDPLNLPPDLDTLLQRIPDGTVMNVDWRLLDRATGSGSFEVGFRGGTVDTMEGQGSIEAGPCSLTFTLQSISFGEIIGADYPTADLSFDAETSDSRIQGTISFTGTSTAVVTLRVDGGPERIFSVDLTTGRITERAR